MGRASVVAIWSWESIEGGGFSAAEDDLEGFGLEIKKDQPAGMILGARSVFPN